MTLNAARWGARPKRFHDAPDRINRALELPLSALGLIKVGDGKRQGSKILCKDHAESQETSQGP